jgi:hypothetical protein
MTWTSWTATSATGTGTEKLDDCTPNCAAGTSRSVDVTVTFSKPVQVCPGKAYWTQVNFAWPHGLPAAFSGANAPVNPLDYTIAHAAC